MHNIRISKNVQELIRSSLDISGDGHDNIFVISDETTHKLCWPVVSAFLPLRCRHIVTGVGELNKNLHSCMIAWKQLLLGNADRHTIIINLGGGAVTDMGGFVASTFMRGIRFMNIPTTLLGMVDASLGGKTGVDLEHYKNIVGTFAFPDSVLICPAFLDSLPDKEWKNGISEMLKHGLIHDTQLWSALSDSLLRKGPGLTLEFKSEIVEMIPSAVKVKTEIVSLDPEERHERKFLNFGHTVGHAIESWSLKHESEPISHGHAVGIGMICESFLSHSVSELSADELNHIVNTIRVLFPHFIIHKTAMQEIVHIMRADKKSKAGSINMALLKNIGKPVLLEGITAELILESLHYYNASSL